MGQVTTILTFAGMFSVIFKNWVCGKVIITIIKVKKLPITSKSTIYLQSERFHY